MIRICSSRVLPKHLMDNDVLSICPGVFQERIPKARELRATFMGSKCICVSIDPRDDPDGVCDWRSIPVDDYNVTLVDLPDDTRTKCLALMARLNIVFGCFDILETPNGDYVFLEVNESGQFLWIEQADPSIKMLKEFCNFVVGEDFAVPDLASVFSNTALLEIAESEDQNVVTRIGRSSPTP